MNNSYIKKIKESILENKLAKYSFSPFSMIEYVVTYCFKVKKNTQYSRKKNGEWVGHPQKDEKAKESISKECIDDTY